MANLKDYADLGEDIQNADKLIGTNDSDQSVAFNFSFTRILTWIQSQNLAGNTTNVNTATYTVLSTDLILHVSYTSTGTCTITIPSALITSGIQKLVIKDGGLNAATNNIIVNTQGSELIDGNPNLTINTSKSSVNLYSFGGNLYLY